jgi:hypothetical protein
MPANLLPWSFGTPWATTKAALRLDRNRGFAGVGPQAHAMKLAFEKYFLWKARHGYVTLPQGDRSARSTGAFDAVQCSTFNVQRIGLAVAEGACAALCKRRQ